MNILLIIQLIFVLITLIQSHPAPYGQCNGFLFGQKYEYDYKTNLLLNNNDNLEPSGFHCNGKIFIENIWQNKNKNDDYLLMIELKQFTFEPRESLQHHLSLTKFFNSVNVDEGNWPPILVHLNDGNVHNLFVEKSSNHHLIEPTHLNLIVSIMNALKNRRQKDNQILPYEWNEQGRHLSRRKSSKLMPEDFGKHSLFSPMITDEWIIESEMAIDHDLTEHVKGWQNVTLESKIFPNAHSKLFVNFELNLNDQQKDSTITDKLLKAETISQAVYLFGHHIRSKSMTSIGSNHFQAERKPCQPHFCQSLQNFIVEYRQSLSEEKSLSTNSMSIAFLRLLNYIRVNSDKINRKDMTKLLKQLEKTRKNDGNILSTVIDTIAASRHGDSIISVLDYLNLPKCNNEKVNDCERFLVAIGISGSTIANMGTSFIAEHSLSNEQLLDIFVPLLSNNTWSDERVKYSFVMTLSTLLHSYQIFIKSLINDNNNQTSIISDHLPYESSHMFLRYHSSPTQFVDVSSSSSAASSDSKPIIKLQQYDYKHHQQKFQQTSEKVVKHLQRELDNCKDEDCRIVYLNALGNTRIITKYGMVHTFKRFILNGNKRESIASIRALRDCIKYESINNQLNEKLIIRLKQLLMRVVYDSNLDTTTRLIASELLANYIDINGDIIIELIKHLDKFPKELATMIWKRSVQNVLATKRHSNKSSLSTNTWHLHSNYLSGSSASFNYIMGGTGAINASYGVMLELLKGKLPKETSFNVNINRHNELFQDIINVGLFARGLQSFAGSDDDNNGDNSDDNEIGGDEADESTMAGMTLHVLGQQLRPLIFFRSTSELMGHVWSGTGSEPTSVFSGNLLLSDYFDIKPLINGFLVEQTLNGVLSIDITGEIQISIWNRNSHSNVKTKGSMLFQGSQEIYASTERTKTMAKKMFSFGAEAQLNFITDFDFYTSPYRICIQIIQPEFIFRHNTRKYEQVHSDHLHRRIHRRSYKIPAKSYMLNRDNNEMCSLMNGNSQDNGGFGGAAGGGGGGFEDNFFNFD